MKITAKMRAAWLRLPDSYVSFHVNTEGSRPFVEWYAARRNDHSFTALTKLGAVNKAVRHNLKT